MKDIKEILAKPLIVAVYSRLDSDWTCVSQVHYSPHDEHWQRLPDGQEREVPLTGFVRISKPVRMTFETIDEDDVVRNAIASIDEEERKLYVELNAKLKTLKEQRNQLLALTHQVRG